MLKMRIYPHLSASLLKTHRRQKLRWTARLRYLLKSTGDLDQLRLAERSTKKRNSNRHTKHITRRHGDVRISSDCRGRRVATGEVIAVEPVSRPGWSTSRSNQSIELVFLHDEVDALRASQQMVLSQSIDVRFARERSFRLGFHHEVLPKIRHLAIAVLFVEGDYVFERTHRRLWSKRCEISIQVSFELIQQHF